MKRAMAKRLATTGLFALISVGAACAQELPGIPTGPALESFTLPTLTVAPGVQPERIGGSTSGSVLFSPSANLPDFAVFESNAPVNSSLDPTSEWATQTSSGGGGAPSPLNSSTWNASGFQTPGAQRSYSNSRFASRSGVSTRYGQSFGSESSTGGQFAQSTGGTNDLSQSFVADFSAGSSSSALAGPDSTQSDIPDLTASPEAWARSFALGGEAGGPASMESSIQSPASSLQAYGLSPRPTSGLASRSHRRQRSGSSLHDRLASRSVGSTLRARNTNRIHSGLRDR